MIGSCGNNTVLPELHLAGVPFCDPLPQSGVSLMAFSPVFRQATPGALDLTTQLGYGACSPWSACQKAG